MIRLSLTVFMIAYCGTLLVATAEEDDEKKLTEGINKALLDSVVSIETVQPDGKGKPIGTGFLVQHPSHLAVLVTAKHVVLQPNSTNLIPNLAYRLNIKDKPSHLFPADFAPHLGSPWFLSSDADVAVKFIAFFTDITQLQLIPYDFFLSADRIQPGAGVLVAGFPLGQRSEDHPTAIVRKGMVASVQGSGIIADAFTFPGNSGGPVFYVPTVKFSGGLIKSRSINQDRLIGIVSSQVSYVEPAISPQTGRPRVIFEDNAGLTHIVSCDDLTKLLSRADVMTRVRELRPDYKAETGQQPPSGDSLKAAPEE